MTEHRTRIDDVIDRAVRDMLRRDPPAGFRRRVLSRLETPAHRAFLWPGLAVAGAALVILVVATVVRRDVSHGPVGAPSQAARVPENPPAPRLVSIPQPRSDTPVQEPIRRRAARREPVRTAIFGPRDGRVSATSILEPHAPMATAPTSSEAVVTETNVPAPPPLGVTGLPALRPLEISPILVPPIRIAPVQVVPLSPPR